MNHIKQIHAHNLRHGVDETQTLVLKLLSIPNISYAHTLLDSLPAAPPIFLANKLIQAYSARGHFHQCLSVFSNIRRRGTAPNLHSFTFLFAACAAHLRPDPGRAFHALASKSGLPFDPHVSTALIDMYAKSGLFSSARQLFDGMPHRDIPVFNCLIRGYTGAGELGHARELFDRMPSRNVISWTSMVSGYSQNGLYEEAVEVFLRMWEESGVRPNEVTLASVLPACANLGAMQLGERIELYARGNGMIRNAFVSNALLEMYAKCGDIDRAWQLFDEMGSRRVTCSWNSMIMGFAVHGRWKEGLDLFHEMRLIQAYSARGHFHQCLSVFSNIRRSGTAPNLHSFTFLFAACAAQLRPDPGRAIHALVSKSGLPFDPHVSTALIDMYAKSGLFSSARQLFDGMPQRDIPVFNRLIRGYTGAGELGHARELFDRMPSRNVISWTSMVSGYSQNGLYEEAVEVFLRMWEESGVRPNEVTLASVLPACANLGAMQLGERIELYARGNGMIRNAFVSNALLEMYAKCGDVDRAWQLFDEMGSRRVTCSWNSMIMGFAVHGRWKEGLDLFHETRMSGISPDDITFTGVLLACTHGKLVDHGRHFFRSMEKEYSLKPRLEHYGCMVDLLGRAGLVREAYNLITSMPMKPDSVIWGALLGACSFHLEVELAEKAAEFLFELEPWNPGNHVILSNIYAASGHWDGVAKEWKLIKGKQQKKAAGYSLIEHGGRMHKFLVEDKSHPRSEEIYKMSDVVLSAMKLIDLVANLENQNCQETK